MKLIEAVNLALIYRKTPADEYAAISDLVSRTEQEFDMSDAKAIRFENDYKKMRAVCNKDSRKVTIPGAAEGEPEVTVVVYSVVIRGKHGMADRIESGHRYLFYSEKFTDAFAVRVFQTQDELGSFKRINKIHVVQELQFRGATLVLYRSEASDVSRVAVFCEKDCNLTPDALAKQIGYNVDTDTVNKTKVFG